MEAVTDALLEEMARAIEEAESLLPGSLEACWGSCASAGDGKPLCYTPLRSAAGRCRKKTLRGRGAAG